MRTKVISGSALAAAAIVLELNGFASPLAHAHQRPAAAKAPGKTFIRQIPNACQIGGK